MRDETRSAIVFLGAGRITSALAAGLRLAGNQPRVMVYDRHPEKVRALHRNSRVEVAPDLKSAVKRAAMLILAVRPACMREMLEEVAACNIEAPHLCVSLAAGIPLRNLRVCFPARWVRAMPSPVCRIGGGLTALTFDRGIGLKDRKRVRELFKQVGQVVELTEKNFDVFTATYSSSHGYHALSNLARAAEDAGLDRKTALVAAAHGLADGIVYWRESRQSLEELLHEASTPGGIAAAAMKAMDKAGYGRAVRKGIQAGIAQARRNAGRQ